MSVDDRGDQVLRKAAVEKSGSDPKTEYLLRTLADQLTESSSGSTTQFSGTASASTPVPTTPGGTITVVLIRNADRSGNNYLEYTIGAGDVGTLGPGEFIAWSPRGGVTQITLAPETADVDYEVIMNRIT